MFCSRGKKASEKKILAPNVEGASARSDTVQKYEVLYYKRTNKMHKTKGTSRLDGILTIHFPPSNLVTLQPGEADESSDDNSSEDENDEKLTFKQKMKAIRKKQNSKRSGGVRSKNASLVLYSSKNTDVVKRVVEAGSLDNDSIVVLPSWECQIVSNISIRSHGINATSSQMQINLSGFKPILSQSAPNSTSGRLLGKKRPLAKSMSSANTKKSLNPLLRRKGPLQSRTLRPQPNLQHRKPPAQPKAKKEISRSPDSGPDVHHIGSSIAATSVNVNSGDTLSKRKKIVLLPKRDQQISHRVVSASGLFQNDDYFSGAIGEIHAPTSIKSVLKPHQQTGVVFLWNCLTGGCPKLRKLKKMRGIKDNNGAICSDEMGLGKTLMTITTIFALHRRNRNDVSDLSKTQVYFSMYTHIVYRDLLLCVLPVWL